MSPPRPLKEILGWSAGALRQLGRGATRVFLIVLRAAANFMEDDGFDRCAAISYYTLLSAIPFLAMAALLGGWLLGSRDIILDGLLFGIQMVFPAAGAETALRPRDQIGRQGALLLVMLPLLLWTSSYAASSVETALNHIMRSREHRKFLVAKLKSMALLGVGAVCLLLIPAMQQLAVVGRRISPESLLRIGFLESNRLLTETAILLAAFLTFAFALVYVPAIRMPRRHSLWVAAGAAATWQGARVAVAYGLSAAAGPSVLSSSFSFIIAMLLWVYTTATILLYAAEVLALISGRRREALA